MLVFNGLSLQSEGTHNLDLLIAFIQLTFPPLKLFTHVFLTFIKLFYQSQLKKLFYIPT